MFEIPTIKFTDKSTITVTSNNSLIFKWGNEEFHFSEENKERFPNEEGETVIEYQGLTTDPNAKRSFATANFVPKGKSPSHYHTSLTEIYYIYNGTAEVIIDGHLHNLPTGSYITIPKGTTHQVKNPSDSHSLDLLVICKPAWFADDFHLNPMPQQNPVDLQKS